MSSSTTDCSCEIAYCNTETSGFVVVVTTGTGIGIVVTWNVGGTVVVSAAVVVVEGACLAGGDEMGGAVIGGGSARGNRECQSDQCHPDGGPSASDRRHRPRDAAR